MIALAARNNRLALPARTARGTLRLDVRTGYGNKQTSRSSFIFTRKSSFQCSARLVPSILPSRTWCRKIGVRLRQIH